MHLAVNKSQNEGTPAVFMKKPRAAVVATEETKKPRMQLILGIILLLMAGSWVALEVVVLQSSRRVFCSMH